MRALVCIYLILCVVMVGPAGAAKPSGLERLKPESEFYAIKNPVRVAQELLQDLGFYVGVLDGQMGPDLENAIRDYQKKYGLKQTGKVTTDLITHLENIGRVQLLLQRLGDVRKQKQDAARDALYANPLTRQLLEKTDDEIADPTRDVSQCFAKPTAPCLLEEAVASSHAVFEDDLRDWALGEILEAQVRVGMDEAAMGTAGRIKDNRLVIAALANIAKVHARAGKTEEARSGLTLIPFLERRLSVMLVIARHYRDAGEDDKLGAILDEIVSMSKGLQSLPVRLPALIEEAKLRARLDQTYALDLLSEYERNVRDGLKGSERTTLLRQIATALAEIGYAEYGLKAVDDLPDDETRIPILMASARSFLEKKRFEAARRSIERISAERYRSIIMSDLALALWRAGKSRESHDELRKSEALALSIDLPFARNYALLRVVQVKNEIVQQARQTQQLDELVTLTEKITDQRMRAQMVWGLSVSAQVIAQPDQQLRINDHLTSSLEDIGSLFSKAWMLGDLAQKHVNQNEPVLARKAFDLGMETIKELTNPWARSRALAKFGTLVYQLD